MIAASLQTQSKWDDKSHHLTILVKGSERYIFLYDSARRPELLWILDRYAVDPDLSFTPFDRAVVAQRTARPGLQD